MNCREVRRWLSPYLDSELGKTKTFEVSEHLRKCGPCAERFERERRVDSLIRAKLADVPTMDLGRMVREAAHPRRFVLRSWHVGALGLAACVALVAWFAPAPASASPIEDWIAGEFIQATPDAEAFAAEAGASLDLVGTVESAVGTRLSMKPVAEVFPGHVVELVSVRHEKPMDRAPFVEVRLNCCGEPVLLAFASRSDVEKLGRLPEGAEAGQTRRHRSSGLNVSTWATSGVVLVAASFHTLDNIASAFTALGS